MIWVKSNYFILEFFIDLAHKLVEWRFSIISIDGLVFSLKKKLNWRFWLQAAINWEVFSIKWGGVISIIWAKSYNDDYIVSALNNKLNSNSFFEFLKIFEHWLINIIKNIIKKINFDRFLNNWR